MFNYFRKELDWGGRKLVLAESKDDQMTKNKEQVQQVVSAGNVFAILPVTTTLLTGADELADSGIPTYGYIGFVGWDETYWTNWPGSEHAYNQPYTHWPNFKYTTPFQRATGS